MYKRNSIKRDVLVFRRFGRKGYSLFACLGREVLIGTLSVATLSHAKADGISVKPLPTDTTVATDRQMTLDEVSVTGSRAPLTRSQAARMVTVLTREDISAAPVQSVNDLLKYAAGVDVRQRGPIGAQTDISIRGGNYEQITLLVNGINICDPQTGHNTMDIPVDISEIERIEVLEGPAGRVYGTSSLRGAINIITKIPDRTSLDARVEGGSYGYASVGARGNFNGGSRKFEGGSRKFEGGSSNINHQTSNIKHQLSASYTRSDGFTRSKAGSLNGDYSGGKAFYQGSYADEDITVRWHAGLSTKDFGSNTFYGVKWDDQFEHTLKTYTAIQAENKRGKVRLKPQVYWNRNMDRFELYRGSEESVPFNYHRTDVYGISLTGYFDWSLGRTAFGGELRNEDLVSSNLGEALDNPHHIHGTDRDYEYGLNRTNISFSLEHNILLKRFTLSAGLVAVKNSWSKMSMRVYPGVDASYRIGDSWKVYASYNTSLRMPSATELYYSVGGHKADKYLEPEELAAVEGGVKYATRGVQASASVYYNHLTNLIDWIRHTDQGDDAPWESVNFTKVNATGVETSVALDLRQLLPSQRFLEKFTLAYNYIYQDKDEPQNIQSQYSLEYLRHKLVAGLRVSPLRNVTLGINYRWQDRTGTYTDADGNVVSYMPYGVLDAKLQWTLARYRLYLEGNNILGKRYVDYGNVEQPGAWVIAGAAIAI